MRARHVAAVLLAAVAAGCAAPAAEDAAARGPQPPVWIASDCEGLSLVWTPPLPALADAVGPRWTPAPGPVPGRGVFVLFAYACPDSTVAGASTGPVAGGAAIVPIEAPADARGVNAPDGWAAIPEIAAPAGSSVLALAAAHAFPAPASETSLRTADAAGAVRVELAHETDAGRLDVAAVVRGEPTPRAPHGAFVSPSEDAFGVFSGPESMVRAEGGAAVVRATGDTWVSRLGLEEATPLVMVDREFAWEFTFASAPWS